MKDVDALMMIQCAPDKVLYSRLLRCVDDVLAVLYLVFFRFLLIEFMEHK